MTVSKTLMEAKDIPGGSVVKNLPAVAGDTDLIPGPGRPSMSWSNEAHVPQLLSLCSRAREPQLLKPECPRALAQQQERPTPWLESSPHSPELEKTPHSSKDPAGSKINR